MLDQAIGRLDYQLLPRVGKPALLSSLLGEGLKDQTWESGRNWAYVLVAFFLFLKNPQRF